MNPPCSSEYRSWFFFTPPGEILPLGVGTLGCAWCCLEFAGYFQKPFKKAQKRLKGWPVLLCVLLNQELNPGWGCALAAAWALCAVTASSSQVKGIV